MTAWFLAGLVSVTPMSACAGTVEAEVDILTGHGRVVTGTNFSLSELRAMATRSGRQGKHDPMGFYFAGFLYELSVDLDTRSSNGCLALARVTVRASLTDRHIEIGRDLVNNACLFSLAHDHYERHAAADDVALARFASDLKQTSRNVLFPVLGGDVASVEEDRHRIDQAISPIIEQHLEKLGEARNRARDDVDSPEEVERLSTTCPSNI